MPFEVVNQFNWHLAVHASDLSLDPPPSYLLVQDALIIGCGIIYHLWCVSYVRETRHMRPYIPRWVFYFYGGNLAWELFFGLVVSKTWLEKIAFLTWFLHDILFVSTMIRYGTFEGRKRDRAREVSVLMLFFLLALYTLTAVFPDDGQQMMAYWTGILLELPLRWLDIDRLCRTRQTGLYMPEIWITRVLGIFLAYGVFVWRYVNVPENRGYVASGWSIAIFAATMIPEIAFPFVYCWIRSQEQDGIRARSRAQDKRRHN